MKPKKAEAIRTIEANNMSNHLSLYDQGIPAGYDHDCEEHEEDERDRDEY